MITGIDLEPGVIAGSRDRGRVIGCGGAMLTLKSEVAVKAAGFTTVPVQVRSTPDFDVQPPELAAATHAADNPK